MGYHTDLYGTLKLNKQLAPEDKALLDNLASTRRMARNVGPEFGVEGEFYVDGKGMMGQDHEDNIIDYNRPPRTQPSLWLQWVPTDDGWGIEWDQNEKFYNYVEWLEYLIKNILAPKGYVLNGEVEWSGEEDGDLGKIIVKDNVVTTQEAVITYQDTSPKELTNHAVWLTINEALTKNLGMKHNGGGDGTFGFEDEYELGDYKVTIGMRN